MTSEDGRMTHDWFDRASSALRRILGMPDYAAYVEHLRAYHPERPIPSEREFFKDFVEGKYREGKGRCC
jgi:uncharacterized short protein YbdD (DUF466 family)